MVDDVRIVGSDLPAWATENTLKDLVKSISDLKGLTSTESAGIRKAIETLNASGGKGTDSTSDALSKLEGIFGKNANNAADSKKVNDVHNNLADAANEMQNSTIKSRIYNSILDYGQASMFKFGKAVGLSTDSMGSLQGVVIGLAAELFKLTVGGIKASLDMYMELYKSGLMYNNMVGSATHGLGVLGQAATNAGTPVMAMAGLLKKYSETISRYGVESFGMIASKVRDLGSSLGLSASESANALAEYMDNQRRMGTLNSMSMDQVEKNAYIQMRTTMDFAREMGVSTDLLKENQKKIADSTEFKAGLATIPAEIRAKMGGVASQILAMFDAKGMGDAGKELMQVMAKGQLARGDKFMTDLMSLGPKGAQAANQMLELGESFKRGNISQEEMIKRSQGIMASMGNLSKDSNIGEFMAKMGVAGNNLDYLSSTFAAAAEAEADRKSGKSDKDDEIAKSMANMKTVWDKFTNIFTDIGTKLFGNQKFVDSLTYILSNISEKMMELMPVLEAKLPTIIQYIGDMSISLVNFINDLAEGKSIFNDFSAWMKTLGVIFGVLFVGIGNIITVGGWLVQGITWLMGAFEIALLPLIGVFALVGSVIYGLIDGFMNYDADNIWGVVANIFISGVKGIFDMVFGVINFLSIGFGKLMDSIPGLSGFEEAARVRAEEKDKKKDEFFDAVRESNGIHKTVEAQAKEAQKEKEQVISNYANNNAATDQNVAKTDNKRGANTQTQEPKQANEATNTDIYQSNEASNKINKSILEAAKYSNALFEVMNGHLAAIEKNTKMIGPPGNF